MKDYTDTVIEFRGLAQMLEEHRIHSFPRGSIVQLDNGDYGLAALDDGCPPDKLPVRFENNNVWWKPIETCRRVTDLKSLPGWVRRMKLRYHGFAAAGFNTPVCLP